MKEHNERDTCTDKYKSNRKKVAEGVKVHAGKITSYVATQYSVCLYNTCLKYFKSFMCKKKVT